MEKNTPATRAVLRVFRRGRETSAARRAEVCFVFVAYFFFFFLSFSPCLYPRTYMYAARGRNSSADEVPLEKKERARAVGGVVTLKRICAGG